MKWVRFQLAAARLHIPFCAGEKLQICQVATRYPIFVCIAALADGWTPVPTREYRETR